MFEMLHMKMDHLLQSKRRMVNIIRKHEKKIPHLIERCEALAKKEEQGEKEGDIEKVSSSIMKEVKDLRADFNNVYGDEESMQEVLRRIMDKLHGEEDKENLLAHFFEGVKGKLGDAELEQALERSLKKAHEDLEKDIAVLREELKKFYQMIFWDQRHDRDHAKLFGRERLTLVNEVYTARREGRFLRKDMKSLDRDESHEERDIQAMQRELHEMVKLSEELRKHAEDAKAAAAAEKKKAGHKKKMGSFEKKLDEVLKKISEHLLSVTQHLLFLMKVAVGYYFDLEGLRKNLNETVARLKTKGFPPSKLEQIEAAVKQLDTDIQNRNVFEAKIARKERLGAPH